MPPGNGDAASLFDFTDISPKCWTLAKHLVPRFEISESNMLDRQFVPAMNHVAKGYIGHRQIAAGDI